MSEQLKLINENAFLPDPRKRKNLDTSKPIDIRLKDEKDKKPIYHHLPKEGVFKQYEDLDIIASFIAKELLGEEIFSPADISNIGYKDIINGGLIYFMSSEYGQRRTGLLSIGPALLTAMKIWRAIPQESSNKSKLFANINVGIEAIFKIIYRDGEHILNDDVPVFDASPYESDIFSKGLKGKSYIDSISWAVPVFLRILNMTEKKDNKKGFVFDENLRKKSEFLAKWCLKYVNNCMVSNDSGKTPLGWSFTRLDKYKGAERSLYFTYAASTIYLSFYAEYEKYIEAFRTLDRESSNMDEDESNSDDKNKSSVIRIELSEKYWENKNGELDREYEKVSVILEKAEAQEDDKIEDFEENKNRLRAIKKALELLRDPDNADEINFLIAFNDENRITNEVKTEGGLIDKIGQLSRLKWNLEQVAAGIWDNIKDKLEEKFLYEDINATIAGNDAIENGGQTNALFTGLLQIGIILNCAYDVKIKKEKSQKEYERMQDAMFLHVQRVQRFFDKLEGEGRSFGVDSLILRFMEKINEGGGQSTGLSDMALAEKLRKANIKVCSLTPMLLKTNNLLSEYVIQYPQKQMGASLLRISQKRFFDKTNKDKERYRWFWETDGYHAISNYYYIGAIFDFYAYYRKYEQSYVKRYENMRQDLLRDLNFTDQVKKHYQNIADEKTQLIEEYQLMLKAKDEEIDKERAKVKKSEIGDNLVGNINRVIEEDSKYFDTPKFYARIIKGIREQLAKELVERYEEYKPEEDKAILEELKTPIAPKDDGLFSLMQALLADVILNTAIAYNRKPDSTGEIKEFSQDELKKAGIQSAEYTLIGRRQLIKDGLIGRLFSLMFSMFNWNKADKISQKKEDK